MTRRAPDRLRAGRFEVAWGATLLRALFGSLVAFSAYTWLLQHTSVSVVSTYAYVNPVVAVLLGAVVLNEVVAPSMLIGAAIIIAAVAFIVSRGATRPS